VGLRQRGSDRVRLRGGRGRLVAGSDQNGFRRRVHDRANLDAAAGGRAQLGDLDGVVEVARLDDVEAAEGLLGLDERAVRHRAATLDRGGRRRGRERLPARDGPTELETCLTNLLCASSTALHASGDMFA
jgi:hypothetical protein